MRNTELKFIEIIKNSLRDSSYLGDDCAYLKDFNLCVSADSLVEGVHFDFKFISPYLLGRKALKVNISDILASGALPKYATVCLCGKLNQNFISEFYTGLDSCAKEYNVKIVGGDLTFGDKITISICIFADTEGVNISSRKNAKEGYILALSGNFGASAAGLKMLFKNPEIQNEFTQAHIEPDLKFDCARNIAKKAKDPYAMMDSSDGLINALEWISRESNVGFELNSSLIPKIEGTKMQDVLFGGEDYSLVCALSENDYQNINDKTLVPVGRAIKEKKISVDGRDISTFEREEFLHFD